MMMQEAEKNRELVSALADGQLRGEEFARTVEWLNEADAAQVAWDTYHLVGEVLRSGETVASAVDTAFMQRLKLSLQQEKPLRPSMAAINSVASCAVSTGAAGLNDSKVESANNASFRWKLLAGVASLAAVSVIGWQALVGGGDLQGAALMAQTVNPDVAVQQVAANGAPQVMIRDRQLDALLAAHRQFGGTSALQKPAGFLRNATFEGAGR
ncbi:sigma-E factor negative regulatory protein [Rhodoferax sp.]|uniref:sigma-E factor negative regulatory protein n=1 Tax=Rhodoferax sp. TaxID=50421 RepID=UPI0025E05A75|nr:sigma-E factor negative regulatory protein [Rhodoferax sp.]